ncbi:hypothetical protein ACL02T_33120 [Pseudonocardia sp. RS010]|uniref:hypothetical protein n=1 Tax=Pseudonocardia sp. RS010 TaxID=3385979 RepID=UPI0039A1CFF6
MSDTDAIAWWGGFTAGAIAAWVAFALVVFATWALIAVIGRREKRRADRDEQQPPAAPAPMPPAMLAPATLRPARAPRPPERAESRHAAPEPGEQLDRTRAMPAYRPRKTVSPAAP